MWVKQGAKWAGGLVAAGVVLLLLSIFVADRQLDPPFDEAELLPIDVPSGTAIEPGAVLFAADTTGHLELYVRPANGSDPVALTRDPSMDSWRPRLSPNRETVLFYRSPVGVRDTDSSQAALWMIAAQGGEPIEVLPRSAHGWTSQGGAEWSPVGDELVMMGGRPQGIQIWVTSLDGRDVRNLVNVDGDSTDPSWAPDAERILYVACPDESCNDAEREVFALRAVGPDERIQITSDEFEDQQPRFSPNGQQILMRTKVVRGNDDGVGSIWDLRVVPTNRSEPPRRVIGDGSLSAAPMWIDDQTVILHHIAAGASDANIVTARVSDGTLVGILVGPANELFPAP